jgi:hypothetical protein
MVCQRDIKHVTNKQIEWHEGRNGEFLATDMAFNGLYWECYISYKEHKGVISLKEHLNSSVHQQRFYHRSGLTSKCGKNFATLVGLFNHLESDACGLMRVERVQEHVVNVISGRKLITFYK